LYYQKTLKSPIECGGVGLHSGRKVHMNLLPAPPDTGVIFRRLDLGNREIPAKAESVSRVDFATTLGTGVAHVKTVEHLMGTFYGLGVDNVIVELDAAEVPIMDGSAAAFVYLIHEAGLVQQNRTRRYLRVVKPLQVEHGERWIKILPSSDLRVTYMVDYDHPLIRRQTLTIPITAATFEDQVAPARTFGFMRDIESLRVQGLTLGGSKDNAVVLDESKVLNDHLRFPNEFVRHKILDVLGDLALSGFPLKAHVMVNKGGHNIHTEMARLLAESVALHVVESTDEGWNPIGGLSQPFA
jgi:UDP-3-O-[3-hydroxymyristoyl] N-acetylglucosamine deacetylase